MTNIKQISSGSDLDRDKALESILGGGSESEVTVTLPSKGLAYKGFTGVTISPLTYKDEYNILTARTAGADPVAGILQSCIKGININDLLIFDKIYLLMKIREVSYGAEYAFDIICPNCNGTVDSKIDISQLPVKYVPDDFSDVVEIELPVSKAKAIVRIKRSADEALLTNPEDPRHIRRNILSLNGISDELVISRALEKFHIRDIKTLKKVVDSLEFGIESQFLFQCPHCKHQAIMGVPLTASFFSVS